MIPGLILTLLLPALLNAKTSADPAYFIYLTLSGPEISIYSMDPETGALTHAGTQSTQDVPFTLTMDRENRYLYAGIRAGSNAIEAYSVDWATGLLTFINTVDIPAGPVHMTVDKTNRYIFTAPYSTTVSTMSPLGSNGELLEPVTEINTDLNPHAIETDPSNKWLYIACLGTDNIHHYNFDPDAGTITPADPFKIDTETGAGPRLFAFHGIKNFMYVANELNNTVTGYTIDETNGHLTAFQTLSSLPADYTGGNTLSEVHLTPDHRFLYIANRGHNSIAAFRVDEITGNLTSIDFILLSPIPAVLMWIPREISCMQQG
jgi:6-phosphogluconolactonase